MLRSFSSLTIAFAVLLNGCASLWPPLPPQEYSGRVINSSTNQLEPNAKVVAYQPPRHGGLAFAILMDEKIGSATSAADGNFHLRTATGYATYFVVSSADERLSGLNKIGSKHADIVLQLSPSLRLIDIGRGVNPESDMAKMAVAAVNSIMRDISSHPREHLKSLRDYAQKGVITQQQLTVFTANPDIFLGLNPKANYYWGRQVFVFPDAEHPITFGIPKIPYFPLSISPNKRTRLIVTHAYGQIRVG